MKIHTQRGWGKTHTSETFCFETTEFSREIVEKFESGLAIGFGRSYADSSINSAGVYFEVMPKKDIKINKQEMYAICSADVSIGELERAALSEGFFPITVPGTEYVSIGGAIASNIHGKSHHKVGSFGASIIELDLLTSSNSILKLKPDDETSNFFWATVGGMGLTGVILRAKLRLKKIETSYIVTKETRVKNINELLETLDIFDQKYEYTVAWIDLSGSFSGRGRVLGGNHANLDDLIVRKINKPMNIVKPRKLRVPAIFPNSFINNISVKIFNFVWFYKPLENGLSHIRKFLHPLDSAKNWNNVYGRKGLIQFQFQIPFEEKEFFIKVFEVLKEYKIASFLGVLKRFGTEDLSLLGFPSSGWTLAVDFPARRIDVIPKIHELIEELIKLNGKIYLTKDAIMTADEFTRMYKDIDEWKRIKKLIDPQNFWKSDQGRRLGLC